MVLLNFTGGHELHVLKPVRFPASLAVAGLELRRLHHAAASKRQRRRAAFSLRYAGLSRNSSPGMNQGQ